MRKRHLRWSAAPLLLAFVGIASVAKADQNVPSAALSTVPSRLVLAGQSGGVPDPVSAFTCTMRWLGGGEIPNSLVTIDLSACPGVRFCSSQPDPSLYGVVCSYGVAKLADGHGQVTFHLVGSAVGSAGGPCATAACAKVYADGVLMRTVPVVTPDLDGNGGIDANDLSLWLSLYFSGVDCPLADYDGDGSLGPGDLSLWLGWFFAGGSTASCVGATCP